MSVAVLTAEVDGRNTGDSDPFEKEVALMVWDGLTPYQKVLHYCGYEHEDHVRDEDWRELKHFHNEKMERVVQGVNYFTINSRDKSGKKFIMF